MPEAGTQDGWQSVRYPALREIVLLDYAGDAAYLNYHAFADIAPAPRLPPGEAPSVSDDAIITYTSGSSSRPKSVPLSHRGIIENGFNIGERQGYRPHDRVLLAPPPFWSYGCAEPAVYSSRPTLSNSVICRAISSAR